MPVTCANRSAVSGVTVGKDDFHLDLLFFHRHLRRLIAVELKLESFQPAPVGQMEFYLRWRNKHERAPGKEAPIGLILCASADAEQVELLELDAKSIRGNGGDARSRCSGTARAPARSGAGSGPGHTRGRTLRTPVA